MSEINFVFEAARLRFQLIYADEKAGRYLYAQLQQLISLYNREYR